MLDETQSLLLAEGFSVYDHEWRYISAHVGEPQLVEGLLVYDDGTVLSLCAFSLSDATAPVAWSRIQAALATLWDGRHHRLVHIWGVFEPEQSSVLTSTLQLANRAVAGNLYEGEFKIDLRDLSFAEDAACRKTRRQIRNKGVEVTIARSGPLTAAQLRLIECWRSGLQLSPLSISAGQAIAAFVRDRASYTATATIDSEPFGFSVFSCPNVRTAVNLMSFSERVPGSRIDDALQWESTLFARGMGCSAFHLGYAGYNGLANFKRKWGARQAGPAYRTALYAVDEAWEKVGLSYSFAWITRLHRGLAIE